MAIVDAAEPSATATGARRISILGATGSIGMSTADLVRRNPEKFDVSVLTANRNVQDLAALARELRPSLAIVADETAYADLKQALADTDIEVAAGADALVDAAQEPVDLTVAGIVGAAGLEATLAAIRQGAIVALANKECLVCAGDLVLEECARSGTTLLPLDSEHNAIFQVFETENAKDVEKLILTASGGPFRTWSRDQMAAATSEQAIAHPNWPSRMNTPVDRLDLAESGSLDFKAPDDVRFPAISLARQALETGQGATAVLNAANEVAVQSFLDNLIGFLDIAELVHSVLDSVEAYSVRTLDDFRALDTETRAVAESLVKPGS